MAVTVQLEYESVSSHNLHVVRIKFFNGGPNKSPSANTVGNTFAIYDTNGTKHWQYSGYVPYTVNDYLWPHGTPFGITALIWLQPGTEGTFYAKTSDIDDLYGQYSAESNRIFIKAAGIDATPIAASTDTATIDFKIRNPHDEKLCLTDMNDDLKIYDINSNENYWIYQSTISMKPNSRRDLSYGLVTPDINNSYIASPKTIEIATTYTKQIRPNFKVKVENNVWTMTWYGTADPNYPTGDGVKRTDIIEIYSRWGDPYKEHLVYTKTGVDFTKPGNWSFTFDGLIRIVLGCKVEGLWDSNCNDTVYSQILSSGLYFGNTDPEEIPEDEGTTTIPIVDKGTIGYVKVDNKYRRVRNAFIKINGKYVPIRVVYYKQGKHYSPRWGDWNYIN